MRRALSSFALALLFAGCLLESREKLDLGKWQQEKTGLASYSFTLTRGCECLPNFTGPYLIEVSGDSVTRVRWIDMTGLSTPPDTINIPVETQAYSLDTLFAQTVRMLSEPHASANVRYNREYGFPEFVYIDISALYADDEYQWEITNFEAIAK